MSKRILRAAGRCWEQLQGAEARIQELESALRAIAEGRWNVKSPKRLSAVEYARKALRAAEGKP